MLRPDVDRLEALEVALAVLLVPLVTPEEARHTWERLPDDHLAGLSRVQDTLLRLRINDIDVHSQTEYLHLASVDRTSRVRGDERGGGIGATGCVAEVDVWRESVVEPAVLLGGERGAGCVDYAEAVEVEVVFGQLVGHLDFEEVAGGGAEVGDFVFLAHAEELEGIWVCEHGEYAVSSMKLG